MNVELTRDEVSTLRDLCRYALTRIVEPGAAAKGERRAISSARQKFDAALKED